MEISYNKNHTDLSGNKFEFRFNGEMSDGIEPDTTESIIDDFINNHPHSDMIKNVEVLRTILKNYKEKLLVISYKSDDISEVVKYDNGNLFLFEKSVKTDNESYTAKYSPSFKNSNIDFKYNMSENDVADYQYRNDIVELMRVVLNHIYQLKHTFAIKLNRDEKCLIEIYKLFYGEYPNFREKNINVKIQTMMSILAQFNISLGYDYGFSLLVTPKMPISLNLKHLVNNLYFFGEISDVENPVILANEPKKIIKIVGDTIREAISDSDSKDDDLITISKIIHAGKYHLNSNSNMGEIAEFTSRSIGEVESSIQLVKKIETRIGNETN